MSEEKVKSEIKEENEKITKKKTKKETNKETNKETKKKINKKIIVRIIGLLAIIAIGIVAKTTFFSKSHKEIITSSQLQKVINISELSTYQAVYNGIAKMEKDGDVKYYVSYEAKVNAGLDIKKIKIDVDNDTKRIVVKLPEIIITDRNVDITTLDYIFMDDKANTSTVSEEAYKLCIKDVEDETISEKEIYDLARQNAENIVKALLKPFVNQLDTDYVIEID